jgi:hypothetical protein
MTALSAKEEEGLKKALGKEGRGGTKALGEKRPWGKKAMGGCRELHANAAAARFNNSLLIRSGPSFPCWWCCDIKRVTLITNKICETCIILRRILNISIRLKAVRSHCAEG